MSLIHADVHIREISLSYRIRGQWRGELTVVRPPGGREYAWPRRLTAREIAVVASHLAPPNPCPRDIDLDADVLDVYHDGRMWKARAVHLEN